MVKKINFSVTSYEGDTQYSLVPKEALQKIKAIEKEENKWIFLGKEHRKGELLTESDLSNAVENKQPIVLMNAIAGGNCDCVVMPEKIVKIEVETSKKQNNTVSIDFDCNEYRKKVVINIDKAQLYDVLHDRQVIVNALKKKLNDMAHELADEVKDKAVSEINAIQKALNI